MKIIERILIMKKKNTTEMSSETFNIVLLSVCLVTCLAFVRSLFHRR